MSFKIGEKVVCIKNFEYTEDDDRVGNSLPVKGDMYTIREISFENSEIYFKFMEIRNPMVEYSNGVNELEFWSGNFRKLDYQFAENLLAQLIEEELCITK